MRLFKNSYGQTPHQYLTEQRIRKAKQLLRSGMPATEVCRAVGFESISSFTRLFKKMTGTPPSIFQKNSKMKIKPLSPIAIGYCVNPCKRA
ncbi:MAG TPA: helix-turn-helix domain-containing protein [Chitinophagaceae bacterium]